MGFNHTNQCSCPVGCCFCGPSNDNDLAIVHDPIKNEIYLFDRTGSAQRVDYLVENSFKHVYLGMLNE